MNTREIAMEYRLASWAQALQERTANQESVKKFCERKGISKNTYFYWQRKLRKMACEKLSELQSASNQKSITSLSVANRASGFTEVKVEERPIQPALPEVDKPSQMTLEIRGVKITTDSAYPADKLVALCRELAKL